MTKCLDIGYCEAKCLHDMPGVYNTCVLDKDLVPAARSRAAGRGVEAGGDNF